MEQSMRSRRMQTKSGPPDLSGGKLHLPVLVDRSALEIFRRPRLLFPWRRRLLRNGPFGAS
jgi:hypothetical protein